jgi:cytochrome c oxidase subunit 2
MTRRTLAAGLLANQAGNLVAWISNPGALKSGARMPAQPLTGEELAGVTRWLDQLY